MITLETALQRICASIPAAAPETIPIEEAAGRVLTSALHASHDLPAFDNSAVDGYALRAADLAAASQTAPVTLEVIGQIPAGETFDGTIQAGKCAQIFTGSPLPAGADAVVMQEDTRPPAGHAHRVQVSEVVKPWDNVRLRGVDLKAGEAIGAAGARLTAARLGLLAAAGIGSVPVGRRPRVALLATGSELREPSQPLRLGQIHESNRPALAALIRECGGHPQLLPIVADSAGATRAALAAAFAAADLVVTCGGVSVGELDFVKDSFQSLGGELDFWRIAMRPGKPFAFGRWGEKFLFGLPGNPVSAFVTFLLLVRPAILRWQGAASLELPTRRGILIEPLANHGERRHFIRVILNADGEVTTAGMQQSHAQKSLAAANGLVDVAAGVALPAGTEVVVRCYY